MAMDIKLHRSANEVANQGRQQLIIGVATFMVCNILRVYEICLTTGITISLDKRVSAVEAGIEGEGDGGKQHQRSEEEEVTGALEHCRTVLILEGIEHEIHT